MAKPTSATSFPRQPCQVSDDGLESEEAWVPEPLGTTPAPALAGARRFRLENLPRRKLYRGSAEELSAISWEDAWKPDF